MGCTLTNDMCAAVERHPLDLQWKNRPADVRPWEAVIIILQQIC